ncbi:MFS transporter [Xylariaceae sp. FL0255]|nr:MFS transporter [Xylariaceae sp. FL0255]
MDETQPLLADIPVIDVDAERCDEIPLKDLVDFNADGDDENPMEWPSAYKWGIAALLALMAFTVTFTCISVVPIANRIAKDLDNGQSSKSSSVLLVTIWELGEAAGPLFIAPLSEVFGRYPVINGANLLFIFATVLAALSNNAILFIAARALTGVAVASNVLNPAIVGDMFPTHQRGSAISLIAIAPLIGGAIGPAIAGAIAETVGWRRVIWMSVGLAVGCEVLFLTCFRETYKVVVLRKKAARLRKETGNHMLKTVFDVDDGKSDVRKMWESVLRPIIVFFGSGVLQAMSLHGAVVFSYFYIMSTTMPDILQDIYNLSPAATGLAFMTFSAGSTISVILMNVLVDKVYVILRDRNKGNGVAEFRLPITIIGSFALPLSMALYGWAAELRAPLMLFLFNVGFMGFSLMFMFLPLQAYVVDALGLWAASGMTAVIVTRCLMSTFLPLATEPLVTAFGWGLGLTILAGVLLVLAPIPILIYRYGAHWRQSSSYTKDQYTIAIDE